MMADIPTYTYKGQPQGLVVPARKAPSGLVAIADGEPIGRIVAETPHHGEVTTNVYRDGKTTKWLVVERICPQNGRCVGRVGRRGAHNTLVLLGLIEGALR